MERACFILLMIFISSAVSEYQTGQEIRDKYVGKGSWVKPVIKRWYNSFKLLNPLCKLPAERKYKICQDVASLPDFKDRCKVEDYNPASNPPNPECVMSQIDYAFRLPRMEFKELIFQCPMSSVQDNDVELLYLSYGYEDDAVYVFGKPKNKDPSKKDNDLPFTLIGFYSEKNLFGLKADGST